MQLGIASLRDRSYKTSSEVLFSWDNIKVFRSWTMLPTPYGSRPLCRIGLVKCGRKSKSDLDRKCFSSEKLKRRGIPRIKVLKFQIKFVASLSHTHTHTRTHSLFLTCSLSLSDAYTLSVAHSCILTHKLKNTSILSNCHIVLTISFSIFLCVTHTHTLSLSHTHIHTLSLFPTHTHTLSLSQTHTL